MQGRAAVVATGLLMLLVGTGARAQVVTPVPAFDMNKAMGGWYEIARLPNRREKKCVSDVAELIADGSRVKTLQIVSSCQVKQSYRDWWNGTLRRQDKKGGTDGKLKLVYFWPFSTKCWVIAVDEGYTYALAGSPNHKELWMLSRSRTMKPELLEELKAKAVANGFRLDKLIVVPQTTRAAVVEGGQ